MMASQNDNKIFCSSEYDPLNKVIMCEPQYMEIREVINETQKYYTQNNIDQDLAMNQHRKFTSSLRANGVEVLLLPPDNTFPEQVFTRDIGFTIGNQVFVAQMASSIRKGEEKALQKRLNFRGSPFIEMTEGIIEGGDVMINQHTVYVGISSRTNKRAVAILQEALPNFKIIPIPFHEEYLHLDCVFNILSRDEALYFPAALSDETIMMLKKQFRLIEVTEEEQFTLGTNVLSIGNKKVYSLPSNQIVNEKLRERGYDVIEIDLSEIIKSGGSFRCCTMPILRKEEGVIV